MSTNPPLRSNTALFLIMAAGLLLLASCQSATRSETTSSGRARGVNPNDKLSGSNTLSQVSITTDDNVSMSGTTVDGRRIKAQGRTTSEAVDNLGTAANASR